jgi:dTDP-4-dehydrorhamnose 3,5-epimerase
MSRIEQTHIPGVLMLSPRRVVDERGFFSELWSRRALEADGVVLPEFVQDNHSLSARAGTVRGLHYQAPPHAQGKLVRCGRGRLLDVAVDVRRGSPSYGRYFAVELSFENARQLWIPPGFLHGFITYADNTEIIYKCTAYYAPESEGCVRWDSAGINWGFNGETVVSAKDAAARPLVDFVSPFHYEAES